jgi:N-acetylglutamate synthase-like GNAT family acetyltransferase
MLTVRKANAEDADRVADLLKAKYSFATVAEARTAFAYERAYHHFRVAEDSERILGLISWQPQGTTKHGVAEVTRFAVLQDAPNQTAIKEQLFDATIAEAELYYESRGTKLRKIFSMIHADSKHLQNFFANKGMHQEAVLKDHYHFGQDELVFSMFLG